MTRRTLFFRIGLVWIFLFTLTAGERMVGAAEAKKGDSVPDRWVFIGNYSSDPTPEMVENHLGKAQGIYVADYDSKTGRVGTDVRLVHEMESPNFLALSPNKQFLYAISGPEIHSFKIDSGTGNLTLINKVKTEGAAGYCHVAVSPDGGVLGAADYPAGLFDFYRLNPDGSIGEHADRFDKFGSGPDARRQKAPFGHAVYFVGGDDGVLRAFLVDLGSDRVSIVDVDPKTGKIVPDPDIPELKVPAGHGSRHLAWHRNDDGSLDVFVNNELTSTVTFFRVKFGAGADGLTDFGTVSTLPAEFDGKVDWEQAVVDADENLTLMNSTAETAYRPGRDGNPPTVYVSNRGHDSIAVFKVVKDGGRESLQPIQFQSTFGSAPRYFEIDETGDHLIVCNKRSGSIFSFNIAADGTLTKADFAPVRTPWPVTMVFIPKE